MCHSGRMQAELSARSEMPGGICTQICWGRNRIISKRTGYPSFLSHKNSEKTGNACMKTASIYKAAKRNRITTKLQQGKKPYAAACTVSNKGMEKRPLESSVIFYAAEQCALDYANKTD